MLMGVSLALHDLTLSGLNSFDLLRLLVGTGPQALASTVGLRSLFLQVGVSLTKESDGDASGALEASSGSDGEVASQEAAAAAAAAAAPPPPPSPSLLGTFLDMWAPPKNAKTTSTPSTTTTTSEVVLALNFSELTLGLSSDVALDLSKVLDLTVAELGCPGCLLSSFDELSLTSLGLHMDMAELLLQPTVVASAPVVVDTTTTTTAVGAPPSSFTPPDLSGGLDVDLAPLMNKLLNASRRLSGELLTRALLAPLLASANATCHNATMPLPVVLPSPEFNDDMMDVDVSAWERGLASASVLVLVLALVGCGVVSASARASHRNRKRRLVTQQHQREAAAGEQQQQDEQLLFLQKTQGEQGGHHQSSLSQQLQLQQQRLAVPEALYSPLLRDGDLTNECHEQLKHDNNGAAAAAADRRRAASSASSVSSSSTRDRGSSLVGGGAPSPGLSSRQKSMLTTGDGFSGTGDDAVNVLWLSPKISKGFKYGIPAGCVVIAALFISSNLEIGASVYAVLEIGPLAPVKTKPFFDFTLQNSVQDMWDAKVYTLSVLIAVFSGAWPYLKLLMIGGCWVLPMRVGTRERVYQVLDALGKWSLLDSYVMVAMMVAFNFKIFLGERNEAIKVTIYTVPGYGFYMFLLCTMGSLVLGHVAIFFHRYAASPVARVPEGGAREALCAHAFKAKQAPGAGAKAALASALSACSGSSSSSGVNDTEAVATRPFTPSSSNDGANASVVERQRPTKLVVWGVGVLVVGTFVTLMLGAFLNSFVFEFGGLTGWILDSAAQPGSSPVSKAYSLVSTYETLPK
jgi:hypothetical protein